MVDVETYKKRKKELCMTFEELSNLSGVPIQTLHNVFRGHTVTPRIDTVQAIERALGISSSAQLERTNSTDKTVLTEKQKRMLDAFNSLLPAMQEYVLGITEKLAAQTGIKNDKARIG